MDDIAELVGQRTKGADKSDKVALVVIKIDQQSRSLIYIDRRPTPETGTNNLYFKTLRDLRI